MAYLAGYTNQIVSRVFGIGLALACLAVQVIMRLQKTFGFANQKPAHPNVEIGFIAFLTERPV
ncbi:MAG: hypothetical protein NW701_09385 [Nitrospira sp.]